MARKLVNILFKVILRLLTRIEVLGGLENVPREGAAIIAINHLGAFDTPLVYILINRSDFTGWVTDKHRTNFLFQLIVRGLEGIWINREGVDTKALRKAYDLLDQGWLLGIAPEGTRSPTGTLMEGKQGAAYIAAKTQVPIIPTAITGTENIFTNLMRFRRTRLTVRFGTEFTLPPILRSNRNTELKKSTDEIMCRIAALLPERYHGHYANHPRLKELLASDAK